MLSPLFSMVSLHSVCHCSVIPFQPPPKKKNKHFASTLEVQQMLPWSLSQQQKGWLMVLSSRLGMPPFLGNSRLSSIACSAFPPSEGNKLNNIHFTACPQVSSERRGDGTLRPTARWVQISVPLLAYTSCRAGPKVLCSHYPGARIARMWGWPDV